MTNYNKDDVTHNNILEGPRANKRKYLLSDYKPGDLERDKNGKD